MTELRVNTIKGQNGTSSTSVSKIVCPVNSIVQTLTCSTIDVKDLSSVTGSINAANLGVAGDGTVLTTATSSSGTLNANTLTTTNLNFQGSAIKTKPPFASFAYGWDGPTIFYERLQNLYFGGYRTSNGTAVDGYQETDAVEDVVNNGRFDYFTFGKAANNYRAASRFQMLFKTLPPSNNYTVVVFGKFFTGGSISGWSCYHNSDDISGGVAGGARLQERFAITGPTVVASNSYVAGMVFI
tara:strand:- start:20284 stop:21006 length:723 start_codon:yes stop_codon:yes gene_type:complete